MEFHTTRWSVVLAAGGAPSPARKEALEELCGAYWYPLYAYLRRGGRSSADAADLVQQFFALLLERGDFGQVDQNRGRFRAWLITALRHFVANQDRARRALRRGGGVRLMRFDVEQADSRWCAEPADGRSPEQAFDCDWALGVLARALEQLRAEQDRIGRLAHFEALYPALTAEEDAAPQAEVARRLGVSATAVKVALHRLRRRLGELVREQVLATLADPGELEEELGRLLEALAQRGRRAGPL
jgi:RNA polymerase sigma-70 factor (ECF subfamily)